MQHPMPLLLRSQPQIQRQPASIHFHSRSSIWLPFRRWHALIASMQPLSSWAFPNVLCMDSLRSLRRWSALFAVPSNPAPTPFCLDTQQQANYQCPFLACNQMREILLDQAQPPPPPPPNPPRARPAVQPHKHQIIIVRVLVSAEQCITLLHWAMQ